MKIIRIGKCSTKFLIIISLMIFWFFRATLLYYQNLNYPQFNSPFFFSFFSSIGFVLGGFLELISRLLRRKQCISQESLQHVIERKELFFNRVKDKKNFFIFNIISIIPLSIIFCINYPFYTLVDKSSNFLLLDKMKVGHILFDVFLSRIFLKYSIYRHQIVSVVIIIIGIGLILFDFFGKYWFECIYCFLYYICYAFPDVLIKLIANKKKIDIFMLMFLDGMVMVVINFISFIILRLIKCTEPSFFPCRNGVIEDVFFTFSDYFSEDTFIRILFTLGYLIIHFGYLTFLHLTVYYFTPIHRGMSDSFSALILLIFKIIIGDANEVTAFNVYSTIGYFIIVISTLIYNEFIILTVCNLHEYTKQEIDRRGSNEKMSTTIEIETIYPNLE